MNTNQEDVLGRIRKRYDTLSKSQKRLADFILSHYEKAVYMTAAKMGETVGVSESTVVRFACEVGYDGYPGMQRALEEVIRVRLTALQRMEVSMNRVEEDHILSSVLRSDIDNIKDTLAMQDLKTFQKVCQKILDAKTVYILGIRSSEPLAVYLGYYLNLFFNDVRPVVTGSISETFEKVMKITEQDVLIGISFPRYSKRTLKAMAYAKAQGACVIAITDSDQSPVAADAQYVLKAQSNTVSFVDSIAGPLSLINALIVSLSISRSEQVEKNLADLERIWKEYDVYENVGEDEEDYGKLLS
ncbi:MAG: MurR/RpiR family transcriptional regulator [Firmicutes bacterium]|nr:MurR/RpiR family transcriptional regulator [Bacillota bacterium]